MPRTSSFPIYDELKFDGQLAALLNAWKEDEKLTIDDILFRLRAEHDVRISRSTVIRWIEKARAA